MRASRKEAPSDFVSFMRVSNGSGAILALAGQSLAAIMTHHLSISTVATVNVVCSFGMGICEGMKTHTVKHGHRTMDMLINRFGNTFSSLALLVFACAHANLGYFLGLFALIFICVVGGIASEIARFVAARIVQTKKTKLRADYAVTFEYASVAIIIACEVYYCAFGKNIIAYQLNIGASLLAVLLTDLLFFHEKELPVYISNVIGCCITLYMQIFVHFGEHWILEMIDGLFLGFASAYTRFVDTVAMPAENVRKGDMSTMMMNVGVNGIISILFYSLMWVIPPIQTTMNNPDMDPMMTTNAV